MQVIYQDGVREVLDIRDQEYDGWWLSCLWIHAPKRARTLCWIHTLYRLQNYPRFARDCCKFTTTCFCFYLTADSNKQLLKNASFLASEPSELSEPSSHPKPSSPLPKASPALPSVTPLKKTFSAVGEGDGTINNP